ncbi:MAG TPA: hypothetical protein VJ731_07180 [Terriglobales bacterium]|nr:hypothetical protein [Terriglobales bacterium]
MKHIKVWMYPAAETIRVRLSFDRHPGKPVSPDHENVLVGFNIPKGRATTAASVRQWAENQMILFPSFFTDLIQ